jgi:predicted nucleotidyltransferase
MSFLDQKKLSLIYENILKEKYYNDTLNPNFWENGEFFEEIRQKLLEIAQDFYDSLDLEASILDIQLTGSLANYNYTEYSDIDVHIIIDFKEINKDESLVKIALDGLRFIWNQRHDISIRGHDVELYIQDESEQHTASGLYSLL